MQINSLKDWVERTENARSVAHEMLAFHEGSRSRVYTLNDARAKLNSAPNEVMQSFNDSVLCLENELFKPAYVMAWSGFFFQFSSKFWEVREPQIKGYDSWRKKKPSSAVDLFERGDSDVLEAALRLGFIDPKRKKELDGYLQLRNNCAHPSKFKPNFNKSLGFVDSLIDLSIEYS